MASKPAPVSGTFATAERLSRLWRADRVANLRLALQRIGLPAWFIAVDLLWLAKPEVIGIDARHYQRAANAWLAGGNPWAVTEAGIPYASGPHTLLFYAPTSLLPLSVSTAIWMAAGLAGGAWLIRRLELPPWWLLFPPLTHAMWNGNPQVLVVALLVQGGAVAAVISAGLKLYALLPMLWRPRNLAVAGIALAVTLPLLPWGTYIAQQGGVTQHLDTAWNGSAWRFPLLLIPTVLALWVLRRRGAEWLSLPALWPATQFYYVSTVLPFVARRPLAAAALALPLPVMAPVVAMLYAAAALRRDASADTPT